jgi:hypothetical protein
VKPSPEQNVGIICGGTVVLFVLKKINPRLGTQGQANCTTFHQRFEQIFEAALSAAYC